MKFKNVIKKAVSVLVCAGALVSCCIVSYASVEPDKSDNVCFMEFDDNVYESGIGGFPGKTATKVKVDDIIHNNVAKIAGSSNSSLGPKEYNSVMNSYLPFNWQAFEERDFIFSFDVMLETNDFPWMIQGVDGASGSKFVCLAFSDDGQFGFAESGGWGASKYFATYEGKTWYSIDMYFNVGDKTITYYWNGKYLGVSEWSKIYSAAKGGISRLDLFCLNNVSESGNPIYFDNLRIDYVNDKSFYAEADTVNIDKSEIRVKLSESAVNIDDLISNIEVESTESDEKINIAKKWYDSRNIFIELTGDYSENTEYFVKIPSELEGTSGNKIDTPNVYFRTPSKNGVLHTVFSDDFSDFIDYEITVGSTDYTRYIPSNWYARKTPNNLIDRYKIDEDNYGVELCNNSGTQMYFVYNLPEDITSDCKIKFDVKILDYNKGNFTSPNRTWGMFFAPTQEYKNGKDNHIGTSSYTTECLDEKGINRAWAQEILGMADNKIGFIPLSDTKLTTDATKIWAENTYVMVEADDVGETWYTVEMDIDMKNRTISGKINDISIGTTDLPEHFSLQSVFGTKIGRIFFALPYQSVNTENTVRDIVIDNFSVQKYMQETKISGLRLYDLEGNHFGPKQAASNCVCRAEVRFDEDINYDMLDVSNIEVVKNGYEHVGFSIDRYEDKKLYINFDELLEANSNYDVFIRNIQKESGDEFKEYHTSFSTEDRKEIIFGNMKLVDESGNVIKGIDELDTGKDVYLSMRIINTTDDAQTAFLSLCGYAKEKDEKGFGYKFNNYCFDEYEIPAHSWIDINNTTDRSVSVKKDSTTSRIKGFLWQDTSYIKPLIKSITLE